MERVSEVEEIKIMQCKSKVNSMGSERFNTRKKLHCLQRHRQVNTTLTSGDVAGKTCREREKYRERDSQLQTGQLAGGLGSTSKDVGEH